MLTRFLCHVRGLLRRWLPALLTLLLCAAYFQYTTHQEQHRAALAAAVKAGSLNADSPEVATAHNTAVPPFGLVAGKFLFGLGLFFGGLAAVWFVLRFVVPVLPRWATASGYKHSFQGLLPGEKLKVFNLIWLGLLGYFALCVLAACLVS